MKKSKIFTLTLLLAGLVAGCSKTEESITPQKDYLKIFAYDFEGNGAKVSINPNGDGIYYDPFETSWVEDEFIKLNGTVYTVDTLNEYCSFGLWDNVHNHFVQPLDEEMTALYPGASFGDNVVEVSSTEIVLHNLGIHFIAGNRQEMAFPMVSKANAYDQDLYFDHLSAGVQVKLHNLKSTAVRLARLTIVAQSTSTVDNLGKDGIIARWYHEGPWMPMDTVGQNSDEVDIKYASVMNFTVKDEANNDYKEIAASGDLTFCVPLTINSVKSLKVTGYDEDGVEVFHKRTTFGSAVSVTRNKMYDFPTININ